MKKLTLAALLCLLGGCAHFHATQIDESPGERRISFDLKGTTWFTSSQSLARLKALQTDKTQSFGSDLITQQGATNTITALQNIVKILELVRPTP